MKAAFLTALAAISCVFVSANIDGLSGVHPSDNSIQVANQFVAFIKPGANPNTVKQLQYEILAGPPAHTSTLNVIDVQSQTMSTFSTGDLVVQDVAEEEQDWQDTLFVFKIQPEDAMGTLDITNAENHDPDEVQLQAADDFVAQLRLKYQDTAVIGPDLIVATQEVRPRPYRVSPTRRLLQGSCPTPAGYTFYPSYDSAGSNIYSMPTLQMNIIALSAACNALPTCNVINTGGILKSVVQPMALWTQTNKQYPCSGMYVKNRPSACPAVPGYEFYPGLDIPSVPIGSPRSAAIDNPVQLAQLCESDPTCHAFTTNGILKSDISAPKSTWTTWTQEPCRGIYVSNRPMPVISFRFPEVNASEYIPTGVKRMGAVFNMTGSKSSFYLGTPVNTSVAILDTGVDLNNPDLNAESGWNCLVTSNPAQDDNGHGTHCAGVVGGRNQGQGTLGVAPGTKIFGVKVLGASGSGTYSQIACGLKWVAANAAAKNIKVVSLSLGGTGVVRPNCGNGIDVLHAAVCQVTKLGISVVVAAGNSGKDLGNFTPAGYPEVLTVTAMADGDGAPGGRTTPSCRTSETDDSAALFSNYATSPADKTHLIAAPGVCIRSTHLNGQYQTMSGTSMATPHVAGALALCYGTGKMNCNDMTPADIINYVIEKSKQHANTGGDGFIGDPNDPIDGKYYGYMLWPQDLQ